MQTSQPQFHVKRLYFFGLGTNKNLSQYWSCLKMGKNGCKIYLCQWLNEDYVRWEDAHKQVIPMKIPTIIFTRDITFLFQIQIFYN